MARGYSTIQEFKVDHPTLGSITKVDKFEVVDTMDDKGLYMQHPVVVIKQVGLLFYGFELTTSRDASVEDARVEVLDWEQAGLDEGLTHTAKCARVESFFVANIVAKRGVVSKRDFQRMEKANTAHSFYAGKASLTLADWEASRRTLPPRKVVLPTKKA